MPMMQKTLAEVLTVARASAGTVFDAAGNLTTVAANQPRFDYDPVTKAFKGLLVEEQRTNFLVNSVAAGASIGSPGVLPVGWSVAQTPAGGAVAVTGVGMEANGIPYVDLTFSGTTTNGNAWLVQFGAVSVVAGLYATSLYAKLVAGALPAAGVTLAGGGVNGAGAPVKIDNLFQRISAPQNIGAAGTAYPWLQIPQTSGGVYNFTLRLAAPQYEAGAFPTSYIPTTTAAVTRAADVVQVVDGLWRGNSAHTLYVEASRPQISSGTFASLRSAGGNEMSIQSGFGIPGQQRLWVGRQSLQQALIGTAATAIAGQIYKMAGTVSEGRAAYAQDGVLVGAQSGVQLPPLQIMSIGSMGSSGFLNGHIRQVQYTDRVLSAADLIAVSQKGLAA